MDEATGGNTNSRSPHVVQEDETRRASEVEELTRAIAMQTQAIYALVEQNTALVDQTTLLIEQLTQAGEEQQEDNGLKYLNG